MNSRVAGHAVRLVLAGACCVLGLAAMAGASAQAQTASPGANSGASPAASKLAVPAGKVGVPDGKKRILLVSPQEAAALAKLPVPGAAEVAAQRRRIAALLEANFLYKGILDDGVPRLRDARISEPRRYVPHRLFSSEVGEPEIHYCASAAITFTPTISFITQRRHAEITIKKQPGGGTGIQALVHTTKGCPGPAETEPFPEFEQARNKHRAALGKPL
jgi:hypothetical protein